MNSKYVLSDKLWRYLREYAAKHKAKIMALVTGLLIITAWRGPFRQDIIKTVRKYLFHAGRERIKTSTPRECARLMGFPDTFRIPVSDTQTQAPLATR